MQNQKETYENLAQIRRFRLQQSEAEARKSQLEEFLDQFEIYGAEIRGVVAPIKAALLLHGVKTAADLAGEVEQIPSVGRSQAARLLEWRRALEQQFVFDPARVAPQEVRNKIERENAALRFRLETELSGGAHYLRRVKQEIEASRRKLLPALTRVRKELARVEKDLEIMELASRRNSTTIFTIVLIIAFFIGWAMRS